MNIYVYNPTVFKVVNCFHPSETANGQYFLISNNGNEVDLQSTFNKTFNFNTALSFKCNLGFILPV